MPKRTFEQRRRETNARYYQNRKERLQGQQSDDQSEDDGSSIWL